MVTSKGALRCIAVLSMSASERTKSAGGKGQCRTGGLCHKVARSETPIISQMGNSIVLLVLCSDCLDKLTSMSAQEMRNKTATGCRAGTEMP